MPQSFYELLWIFLLYAFVGWCCEVAFAAVELGKFVNRGFLNGPVCPIYGVGMIIIILCLWPLKHNLILLFLGAALLTSLLELITGFSLEKIFNDKWWDYSDMPFNFKGYICLKFSILWGLAASFVIGGVHPFFYFLITKIPKVLGVILLLLFSAAFITDFIITFINLLKLPKKLNAILELQKILKTVSDSIGENISDTTLNAKVKSNELYVENKPRLEELKAEYERKKEEYKKLIEENNFVHKRILSAFPNLKKGKYKVFCVHIPSLKNFMSERKKNEKNSM